MFGALTSARSNLVPWNMLNSWVICQHVLLQFTALISHHLEEIWDRLVWIQPWWGRADGWVGRIRAFGSRSSFLVDLTTGEFILINSPCWLLLFLSCLTCHDENKTHLSDSPCFNYLFVPSFNCLAISRMCINHTSSVKCGFFFFFCLPALWN